MKRSIILALAITLATTLTHANGLTPDAFTYTWTRHGTTALADTNTWLSGVTYLLTNCQCLNGSTTQNLTSCGVIIRVGDSTTNIAFAGTVQTPATDGKFSCLFTIPAPAATSGQIVYVSGTQPATSINSTGIQLTITNGTVSVTDRELKQLNYQAPLQ